MAPKSEKKICAIVVIQLFCYSSLCSYIIIKYIKYNKINNTPNEIESSRIK